jgi:UDP-glucose 4-epimerase
MSARPSVLVTGHTGFIGQNLAIALNQRGMVWCGVSLSNGFDLTVPGSLDRLPAADWVVHLAGRTGVPESWWNPAPFYRSNLDATLSVLEYARHTGAAVLYLNSYMYGVPRYLPIDESHPVDCNNPYAWSKRQGEMLCEAYARDFGVRVVSFRAFNIYGPYQPTSLLMAHVLAQALAGDSIVVKDLAPKRDYLWVGDMVNAIVTTLNSSPEGFTVYNVGFGRSYSVKEVIDAALAELGLRRIICSGESRIHEIDDCYCDNTHFRHAFGWSPTVSLKEGIARMVSFLRTDRHMVSDSSN